MDQYGKSTVLTEDGRPLISGDGLIPQIERFASKFKAAKITINVINKVLSQMTARAVHETGNSFTFVVNSRLWTEINSTLGDWLNKWGSVPTMLYSKVANAMVETGAGKVENAQKVGATFVSYEIAGNVVNFMVDRALTKEYPNKFYGICLDTTPDIATNEPAIAGFTLKGGEFITSKYPGIGGIDGRSSGIVSSPAAGSRLINSGYCGIVYFAPFRSFILEEV